MEGSDLELKARTRGGLAPTLPASIFTSLQESKLKPMPSERWAYNVIKAPDISAFEAMIAPTVEPTQTAFVSGPLDTGRDSIYFTTHYRDPLDTAIARGDSFVVGPIPTGVDADALTYLLQYHEERPDSKIRVTVYVTLHENQTWGDALRSRDGGKGVLDVCVVDTQDPRERDAAMTRDSTYDILRWRTEEEARLFYGPLYREGVVTSTERNWRRRRGLDVTLKGGHLPHSQPAEKSFRRQIMRYLRRG